AFDIYPRFGDKRQKVRLEGLIADKQYQVNEINMMPGQGSWLSGNGQTFSGDYLMNVGLDLFSGNKLHSRVVEITVQP
ncbi:MAG: GH36 C-terminal domain-containing protein, partial [Bacteroidales bacterium]|nr:GH36 C-terminal domain-containing protein [Bacteroidales bacterium]